MNNFVIASLIGATSAATGPLRVNTFPVFTSTTAPSTTSTPVTKDAADNVLEAYSMKGTVKIGPLRGFRNGLNIFPTQKFTKAATAANTDKAIIVSQAGTTTTFWQTAVAQLGTYFGPITTTDNTTVGNTAADGAGFVVCSDTSTYTKCNGGAGVNFKDSTPANQLIPNRIVFKANTQGAISVGGSNAVQFRWNEDILTASFFQEVWADAATPVINGTKWCSPFKTALTADGSKKTITASNGFNGMTKCTWQLTTADGTQAPGFMMESADYTNFVIQWTEFITVAGLGTDAVLPAADGASYFIGAYSATTGTYMNPLRDGVTGDTTWNKSSLSFQYNEDADRRPAGSLGDCVFFPLKDGPFKDTYVLTTDSYQLVQRSKDIQAQNDKYDKVKRAYQREVKNYEDKAGEEIARNKDIIKSIFDKAISVPERPNVPNFPFFDNFDGPDLNLAQALGTNAVAWATTATTMKNTAYLRNSYGTNGNSPDPKFATRNGYLVSSPNTSETDKTKVVAGVGHAFGWLGQGADSTPQNVRPFYWGASDAANTPTMQVSFFPAADQDAGLDATTKFVKFQAWSKAWIPASYYEKPKLPTKAKAAKFWNARAGTLTDAAAYLTVGATATLAVYSTLI